ncbi:MAG: DUF4162 domain-containing protein, partial [Armatimonadota bacterium]|nr:DUF4162 domain-containing protein [Armatimonadota bacterium]
QGSLVVSGDVSAIMEQCRGGIVLNIEIVERREEAVAFLETLDGVAEPQMDDGQISVKYVGEPDQSYKVLEALSANGFKVRSFSEADVDLEDIFLRVTRGAVA